MMIILDGLLRLDEYLHFSEKAKINQKEENVSIITSKMKKNYHISKPVFTYE